MPGPTTEILNEDFKALRSDVQRIEVGMAEIRTELRVIIGIAKLMLVTLVMGIAASIWWAGTINTEVKNISERTGRMQSEVAEVKAMIGAATKR